jgi:hypothetical protein
MVEQRDEIADVVVDRRIATRQAETAPIEANDAQRVLQIVCLGLPGFEVEGPAMQEDDWGARAFITVAQANIVLEVLVG